jgi:hypothetical protein
MPPSPWAPNNNARARSQPSSTPTNGSPPPARRDGWTPFLRKLFLQVIADTGRLTLACEYTGLTRQSAYALATRDPLFAAGWDAAAMFARRPVNDTMTEQALEGITETITRADGVVVTRHRFDTRLSIAVLSRLDKRCDRAEERGDKHLAVMRNWDEWLDLIGKGDDQAAQAILDGAQGCQNCQRTSPPRPAGSCASNPIFTNSPCPWHEGSTMVSIA